MVNSISKRIATLGVGFTLMLNSVFDIEFFKDVVHGGILFAHRQKKIKAFNEWADDLIKAKEKD